MDQLSGLGFWQALGAIVWVNLLLSGDNAVVIALAARSLPPRQQKLAVAGGSFAAILLRVILTLFAVALLQLPWLKLGGGLLLLWVGVRLLVPEEGAGDGVATDESLLAAVRTILIADLVMSLDNVIAVAAAADRGPADARFALLAIGLGLSVPIVVFGSTLTLKLMQRVPLVITLGAALLGWIAGGLAVSDPALAGWVGAHTPWLLELDAAPAAGTLLVVVLGKRLARRLRRRRAA